MREITSHIALRSVNSPHSFPSCPPHLAPVPFPQRGVLLMAAMDHDAALPSMVSRFGLHQALSRLRRLVGGSHVASTSATAAASASALGALAEAAQAQAPVMASRLRSAGSPAALSFAPTPGPSGSAPGASSYGGGAASSAGASPSGGPAGASPSGGPGGKHGQWVKPPPPSPTRRWRCISRGDRRAAGVCPRAPPLQAVQC